MPRLHDQLDCVHQNDNNYLNTALEDYKQAPQTYKEFKESIIKNTSEFNIKEEYQIKRQYIEYMKNNANNKYIIDNKVDKNNKKFINKYIK